MGELIACAARQWTPGIGDPTAWGWITVLVYAGTAGLCAVAARRTLIRRDGRFWAVLALGLLALAVNKQLDLQSGLTAMARCSAEADGWYDQRRRYQVAFIGAVAALAALGAAGAAWVMRASLRRLWPAVLGTAMVLGFVTIRAAGFHGVDALIGQGAFGVTVNAGLEVGGTLLIALAAARDAGGGRASLANP